jgi:predicted TIM-barrel fold metal-dependent hydrolase
MRRNQKVNVYDSPCRARNPAITPKLALSPRQNVKRSILILLAVMSALLCGRWFSGRTYVPVAVSMKAGNLSSPLPESSADELAAFAALEPIDSHTHDFQNDPAVFAMMQRLHLHVLDICVADSHNLYRALQPEIASALAFVRGSRGHAALCTTFDPYSFAKQNFSDLAIKQINENFSRGAVAVKIWKNIGMEIKTPEGKYVMPDDPKFASIYQDIAAHNKTLIAHMAEPTSCWLPPDPASPDFDYYKEHPEWYMYLHPDHPSKETILAARDHLLAENPKLRVIGAHLGSLEVDVDQIASRFERYQNFAVDMAARMEYLMLQRREKVRDFLIKYQDRVLYATDLEFLPNEPFADALKEWQETYTRDWKFLATDGTFEYHGHQIQGLKLPQSVLRKVYHDNAVRWIPGILPAEK